MDDYCLIHALWCAQAHLGPKGPKGPRVPKVPRGPRYKYYVWAKGPKGPKGSKIPKLALLDPNGPGTLNKSEFKMSMNVPKCSKMSKNQKRLRCKGQGS